MQQMHRTVTLHDEASCIWAAQCGRSIFDIDQNARPLSEGSYCNISGFKYFFTMPPEKQAANTEG